MRAERDILRHKDIYAKYCYLLHLLIAFFIVFASLVLSILVFRFFVGVPQLLRENYELFICLAAGILYLREKYPGIIKYGFECSCRKKIILWGLIGGVALAALNFPGRIFDQGVEVNKFKSFIAGNYGDASIVLFLLFSIIFIPILEEVLLRGYLYGILRDKGDIFWASAVTCLVFAIGHQNVWFAFYSFILIFTYQVSGGLGASIIAHIIWNATWYFGAYL